MSRLSVLIIPALLLSSSTALAASDGATEQVIAFEERVEAPAIAMSLGGGGAQRATEQLAAFEAAPAAASAAALAEGEGPQQVTEQIAAFESRDVQAPRLVAVSAR